MFAIDYDNKKKLFDKFLFGLSSIHKITKNLATQISPLLNYINFLS